MTCIHLNCVTIIWKVGNKECMLWMRVISSLRVELLFVVGGCDIRFHMQRTHSLLNCSSQVYHAMLQMYCSPQLILTLMCFIYGEEITFDLNLSFCPPNNKFDKMLSIYGEQAPLSWTEKKCYLKLLRVLLPPITQIIKMLSFSYDSLHVYTLPLLH